MLAIYIPILRREIFSFVRTWNAHSIRKQKNRPNAVVGRPVRLYYYPPDDTANFGIPYDTACLNDIELRIGSYDTDGYLPVETHAWCKMQLQDMGFDPYKARLDRPEDRESPFHSQYLELRARAEAHINLGLVPVLGLLPNPVGGFDFQV